MARVNVEQKALTDPRFYRLGLDLGAEPAHAHAVGLFVMIRVWNECIERGKYTLEGWAIDAIVGRPSASEKITGSDLAVSAGHGRFRIKGTKGRVEYLEERRRNGSKYGHLGAEHGRKGGRPRKPPVGVSGNGGNGIPENPPPAPAPALKRKTEEKKNTPAARAADAGPPEPSPAVLPLARKPAAGPHPEAVRAFCSRWQERYGEKYPFAGGKDAEAVRWMLAQVEGDGDRLAGVFDRYFADDDPFYVRGRHALGLLRAQFARWLPNAPPPPARPAWRTRGEAELDHFSATVLDTLAKRGVA